MTTYDVPPRLAYVVPDDVASPEVFLMHLPDGPPVQLRDTSAVIWVLAADGEEDVVGAVGDALGVARELVSDDVENHLRILVSAGLLTARSD